MRHSTTDTADRLRNIVPSSQHLVAGWWECQLLSRWCPRPSIRGPTTTRAQKSEVGPSPSRKLRDTMGTARQRGITFVEIDKAAPLRGPVLHLKGFGSGIDYSQPSVQTAVREIVEFVDRFAPGSIVFDGDPYSTSGFTALVRDLAVEPRELVAFKYDGQRNIEEIKQTWEDHARCMRVILVPLDSANDNPEDFAKLGKLALDFSGAKQVVCLGGGETVELEVILNPGVIFDVWPVWRTKNGKRQQCAVASSENSAVHALSH